MSKADDEKPEAKKELSDAYLRGLAPPASGRRELRDSRVTGLVLRMTPTGAATWSLRTRMKDGRQTRPALGTWPAMSIGEARKAALAALGGIQSGADPVGEKQRARAARKAKLTGGATVQTRMRAWQEARASDSKSAWSPRYAMEVARVVKRDVLPKLGKKDLAETTRADWVEIVTAKRKVAPGAASMLYRTIGAFLGYAEAHGWIDSPMLPRKGMAMLAPMPASRDRILADDELLALWKAADREVPKLRAFVRLLILTAARELEVADLPAGEIDLQAARWNLPGTRTKNRMGYVLPLSPLALAELSTVWPNEEPKPGHMLLGRSPTNGFRGFSRLKERLDAASRVTGWRFHDLRRTARTGMTRLGVPRDHAEAAINHLSGRSALERTYDRHDYAPEIIDALTIWQAHVAGVVGSGGKVLSLAQRRTT